MLGVVNTDVLKYLLYESYSIEKRKEFLTTIQSLDDDDEITEALIDADLENVFLFRVKRDPGLRHHVLSKAQNDEKILEKIHTIILQLYGKTVELNYICDCPTNGWSAEEQQKYKTDYFKYRLQDAEEKSESDELILAIKTLLDEHKSGKYHTAPLADNNLHMHIVKKNYAKGARCMEYFIQNIRYSRLYGLNSEPDSLHLIFKDNQFFVSAICLAIFGKDPNNPKGNLGEQLTESYDFWKFRADIMTIICTEWFISLNRDKRLECLNETYPFGREQIRSLLKEIEDPGNIDNNMVEGLFKFGRYDLAIDFFSFVYEYNEKYHKSYGMLTTPQNSASKIGEAYREIRNYEKALEWYDKAKILAEDVEIPAYGFRVNIAEIKYSLGGNDNSLNDYLKEIEVIHDEAIQDEVEFRLDALISITQSCRRVGRYDIEYKYLGELTVLLEKLKNKRVSEPNGDDIIEISFTNEGTPFNDEFNRYSKYEDDAKKRMKELTTHSCRFEELNDLEFNSNINTFYQFYRDELNCFQIERAINNAEKCYKLNHNLQSWTNYVTLSYYIRKNPEDKKKFCNDCLRLPRTENEKFLLHVFLSASITECEGKITDEVKSELKYLVYCLTSNVKNCNNNLKEFLKNTLPVIALWKNDELKKSYLFEVTKFFNSAEVSKIIGMPIESAIARMAIHEELFSIAETFYQKSLLYPQYNHESTYCNLISLNGILNKSSIAKKFGEEALSKYPNSFFIRIIIAEYLLYETEYADAQKYLQEAEELMRDTDETQWSEITEKLGETKETIKQRVEFIKQAIDSFNGEYISFKKINSPVAYRMMQTADYQYFNAYKNQQDDDELDHSPIIIQYGKAVEKLLNDTVTRHLRDCLQPDEIKGLRKGLQHIFGDAKKSVSLGIWHEFYANLPKIKNKNLRDKLCNKYDSLLSEEDRIKLANYCAELSQPRNSAAHMVFNSKEDVDKKRKEIVELINSIIDITAKIPSQ